MIVERIKKPSPSISKRVICRSAAAVTVPDHHDRIARNEHFVIPVALRVHTRRKCVDRIHRPERVVADLNRKKPPAAKYDKMIAVKLYNTAFVNACVLVICYGFFVL